MGSGLFGILRAFSGSYVQFAIFEFFDAFFGAATYSSAFIIGMLLFMEFNWNSCFIVLGLELVTAKRRAVSGTFLNCFYAIGEIYLGTIAYFFRSFRTMLLIIYVPAFLTISYICVLPRSVRWLLAKNRNQEAKKILLKAAKINGKTLKIESLKQLDEKVEQERNKKLVEISLSSAGEQVHDEKQAINLTILLKVANLCFCWFANTFVYFGLNLNSVYLNLFDKYFSYILVCSVEIPAFFATNFLMDWIGRKRTLFLGLFGSGLSCIVGELFTGDIEKFICFVVGKFLITISFSCLYIYTIELFPTHLRHRFFSICSTFARFGSILTPLTPLLIKFSPQLPLYIFAALAFSSSFLIFVNLPETKNKRLPENMAEAFTYTKCFIYQTFIQ